MAGASVVGLGTVLSYGGMFSSVRCPDPSAPECTGLYYNYGVTGLLLLVPAALGLVVSAVGAVSLGRLVKHPTAG